MRVTQTTGRTNLRYGKPWISKITDWKIGERPTMVFGGWFGDSTAGLLEIEASPGDIVRWCIKNYRSSHKWCIVAENGKLQCVGEVEARAHWINRSKNTSNGTPQLRIRDRSTYERVAAHLPEWPRHPDNECPDWDGWDRFLNSDICMKCGETKPDLGRLCNKCGGNP